MSQIYADHAAGTPTDPQVIEAMAPYWQDNFGNPSSVHTFGKKTADAVDRARGVIATFLGIDPEEIIFTSSGTESNNLAILGIARASKNRGHHLVTTSIEHPSVLNACKALERDGFTVTYVSPEEDGTIDTNKLVAAVTKETTLISVHLANSEIGVIQDVAEIARQVKEKNSNALVHVDACQATPFLDLNVRQLGADLLTFNGSKMYGPKGIAALYVRSGVSIFPIMYGGGQEQSLRSGTENVPGIVGLAKAVGLVDAKKDSQRIGALRDRLQHELEKLGCRSNCAHSSRLPNHLSVTLPHTQSTNLVADLDQLGVAVSAGSACSSRSLTESHVLTAIGLSSEEINRTIRITLGRSTTAENCQQLIAAIKQI